MNNKIEEQLAKVIERAIEVAEQTGQFVIDQAPDLLQEFYRWHIAKHCLGVFIAFVLMIIAYRFFKMLGKKEPFEEFGKEAPKYLGRYYNMDSYMTGFFISGSLSVASVVTLSINVYNLVFILTAPKLYLIEYFIK